jgi:hypothetical protein
MIHWTPNLEKYKEYIENPNYKLEGWWIIERFLSIPKPNCCEEIKNYPSVFLDAQRELFYEGAIESVFWSTFLTMATRSTWKKNWRLFKKTRFFIKPHYNSLTKSSALFAMPPLTEAVNGFLNRT